MGATQPAAAQSRLYKQCEERNPEPRIKGCTAIINRGKREFRVNLYNAHLHRGMAYLDLEMWPPYALRANYLQQLGDYDAAIADLNNLIRRNESLAPLIRDHGICYWLKGDFPRAIANLAKAAQQEARNSTRRLFLDYARFDSGDFMGAAADLRQALSLGDDADGMLHLFLTRSSIGEGGASAELEAGAGRLKITGWPVPAIDLYLGRRTAEATLGHAKTVEWQEAEAYAAWLARRTGKPYRLPSEAEWEYAARAGTTTRYYFGDGDDELCRFGNFGDPSLSDAGKYQSMYFFPGVSCRDGHVETGPVGSIQPNTFGLYDMHGNAREWVQDCWNDNYNGAPSDGSARTTRDCDRRMLRGGSWIKLPWDLRSADRDRDFSNYRYYDFGFRVARTLQ